MMPLIASEKGSSKFNVNSPRLTLMAISQRLAAKVWCQGPN